jgi:phosphoglycolate phosphatase
MMMTRKMIGRPSLVVFDLDGTLVDSMPAIRHAANSLRSEVGLPPLDRSGVAACMSGPMSEFVRRVTDTDPSPAADVVERLLRGYSRHYEEASRDGFARPYAGATAMLNRWAELGIAIAILTNKGEALARASLKDTGLAGFFAADAIIGFDTLARPKPDPLPLRHLMRRFGVEADKTWMVGDSGVDILAARAVDCVAIACRYGYGDATDHQPDRVIDDLDDLAWMVKR